MTSTPTCTECGARLPAAGAPCPACLLNLGRRPDVPLTPIAFGRSPVPSIEELQGDFPALELIEFIGRGGMGFVYRARQRDLGREVALKILPDECAAEPSFAERFEREARVLAKLDHPSIVRVFDAGRNGNRYWLTMEYVDGTNLRQVIDAWSMDNAQALDVVMQICSALQYAHGVGVVHRDIKPENILLDKQGQVKIADFGLAKILGGESQSVTLTRSDQALGTPQYMAPEQVRRPLEVDHRADLYSLGVVFYELLTGELPMGRFPLPSDKAGVDARLDEVVLKTLERDPERRYQAASELGEDVRNVSGSAPAQQAACGPAWSKKRSQGAADPESVDRQRRNKLGMGIGCGCLLALVLFVGFLLLPMMWLGATAVSPEPGTGAPLPIESR